MSPARMCGDLGGRQLKWAIVVFLGFLVLFTLRHVGLPRSVTRVPVFGGLFTRYIGIRVERRFDNGRLASRELYRGNGTVYDYWAGVVDGWPIAPMIHGVYYDPSGQVVSRVIDGTGAACDLHENGALLRLLLYQDGEIWGPSLDCFTNGTAMTLCIPFPKETRQRWTRVTYGFDTRGRIKRDYRSCDSEFVNEQRQWYPSGELKSRETERLGEIIAGEYFDPSGVMTQKFTVGESAPAIRTTHAEEAL